MKPSIDSSGEGGSLGESNVKPRQGAFRKGNDMKLIDGHANAFIGMSCVWHGNQTVDTAMYSAEIIVDNLMAEGMSEIDACEYIFQNIECAYVGTDTPILVWNVPLDEAIEMYGTA